MKKNLMLGSVVLATMLLGTGCGGGSSSSNDDSTQAQIEKKTAYYLDSAVSGANYNCVTTNASANGSANGTADGNESANGDANNALATDVTALNSGTTDENGAFNYQDGQICTFSVGGIQLRTVDTAELKGEENVVFEDDVDTAQFLQTLDVDGDASNGIQINEKTTAQIKLLVEAGELDNEVPKDDEKLTKIVEKLQESDASYEGSIVTETEAKAHLEDTKAEIDENSGHITVTGSADAHADASGDGSASASASGEGSEDAKNRAEDAKNDAQENAEDTKNDAQENAEDIKNDAKDNAEDIKGHLNGSAEGSGSASSEGDASVQASATTEGTSSDGDSTSNETSSSTTAKM